MSALSKQFDKIEQDILQVLAKDQRLANSKGLKSGLSQDQLHFQSELRLAPYGWSFAIERLEKKHLIEVSHSSTSGELYWRLKDPARKEYVLDIQEFINTKLSPD